MKCTDCGSVMNEREIEIYGEICMVCFIDAFGDPIKYTEEYEPDLETETALLRMAKEEQ